MSFYVENLIKTVDKPELLATLRVWREESKSKDEATLLTDLIDLVASGDLDG